MKINNQHKTKINTNFSITEVNTTLLEKDIIRNFYGNDPEIPQTIYDRIQKSISKGNNTNALLKIKIKNESSIWVKNTFYPKNINNLKFKVKTIIADDNKTDIIKNLYNSLIRIEQKLSLKKADKFLEGYLEEKCMNFNDLISF